MTDMKRFDWHNAVNAETACIKLFTIGDDGLQDQVVMELYTQHFSEPTQVVLEGLVANLCEQLNAVADEVSPVDWGKIWP